MLLLEVLKIAVPVTITAIVAFLLGKWQTNRMIKMTKSPAFRFEGSEKIGIEKTDDGVKAASDRINLKVINKGSGPALRINVSCERAGKKYILSSSSDSFDLLSGESDPRWYLVIVKQLLMKT